MVGGLCPGGGSIRIRPLIVRQCHIYPNSELCAARNTLAIMFFCCHGAVAGRDLTNSLSLRGYNRLLEGYLFATRRLNIK